MSLYTGMFTPNNGTRGDRRHTTESPLRPVDMVESGKNSSPVVYG